MPAANAAGISANKERYGCKMERKNCWKQYSDKKIKQNGRIYKRIYALSESFQRQNENVQIQL